MSVPNAVPLLAKIKEDVEKGLISNLQALHVALEGAISQLTHQEGSEAANVPNDDLFDVVFEMKLINKKLDKCNAKLARLQHAQSEAAATANGTAVAEGTSSTSSAHQPASALSATSERTPAALPPLPPSPPPSIHSPNAGVPTVKHSNVYFNGDRPQYRSPIQDQHGDVIAVDGHSRRIPLRREGAFYGEENLESVVRNEVLVYGREQCLPRRNPLRREGAFYGEENLEAVFWNEVPVRGREAPLPRRNPLRREGEENLESAVRNDVPVYGRLEPSPVAAAPSNSKSVPPGEPTDRTPQRIDVKLEPNIASASQAASPPPSPRNDKGKKRAWDEEDEDDKDNVVTVSTTHPQPCLKEEEEDTKPWKLEPTTPTLVRRRQKTKRRRLVR